MSLLGSNLLKRAARLIPSQTVGYSAFATNTRNAAGVLAPTYEDSIPVAAQVQPVPRAMYEKLGLDLQKNYVTVYCSIALRDLQRDGACDLIDFAGRRFNIESNTDWFAQNGWRGALCVDIGPTP